MSLPNFLIIGAAKAGPNALYHYPRQHPQVYMSPWKEPKFFAFESEADLGFRAANGKDAPVNASVILDQGEDERLFDEGLRHRRRRRAGARRGLDALPLRREVVDADQVAHPGREAHRCPPEPGRPRLLQLPAPRPRRPRAPRF